jgi:hypothetical protein
LKFAFSKPRLCLFFFFLKSLSLSLSSESEEEKMGDQSHLEKMGRELKCPIWYIHSLFLSIPRAQIVVIGSDNIEILIHFFILFAQQPNRSLFI